jgi:uncharacterized protein
VSIGSVSSGSILTKEHRWVFEVAATAQPGLQQPVPLKEMGRFSHEAVAVDASTDIVYETEDRGDAAPFYRFLPNRNGRLQAGGVLRALKINGLFALDTRNNFVGEHACRSSLRSRVGDDPSRTSHRRMTTCATRHRAWGGDLRSPGRLLVERRSRVLRHHRRWPGPSRSTLQIHAGPGGRRRTRTVLEPTTEDQFAAPDNICVAPSGDIIVCEDGSGVEYVNGVIGHAQVYKIARNALNSSEVAGACFSPDGSTLSVNLQSPGITFSITGAWPSRKP